ncbi:hypothetical protein D3C76_1859590 [compost metagenome]
MPPSLAASCVVRSSVSARRALVGNAAATPRHRCSDRGDSRVRRALAMKTASKW